MIASICDLFDELIAWIRKSHVVVKAFLVQVPQRVYFFLQLLFLLASHPNLVSMRLLNFEFRFHWLLLFPLMLLLDALQSLVRLVL